MRKKLYAIEWSKDAEKQFKKLTDQKLKTKVVDIIENQIARDPLIGKPLTDVFKGVRSYRLGRLRILYKPYKDRVVVVILRIDLRKDVYRRRL